MPSIPKRSRLRRADRCRESRAAVCDRFCEALECGIGLAAAADRERITLRTLGRWLAADTEFHARYERARRSGHERLAEEIVALADSGEGNPAQLRRRIAARKWLVMQGLRAAAKAGAKKEEKVLHPTDEEIAILEAALKRNREAPGVPAPEWKGALVFTPDSPTGEPVWRTELE